MVNESNDRRKMKAYIKEKIPRKTRRTIIKKHNKVKRLELR